MSVTHTQQTDENEQFSSAFRWPGRGDTQAAARVKGGASPRKKGAAVDAGLSDLGGRLKFIGKIVNIGEFTKELGWLTGKLVSKFNAKPCLGHNPKCKPCLEELLDLVT